MSDTLHVVCPHCDQINRIPRERLGRAARCGSCRQPLLDGSPVSLDASRFQRHAANSELPLVVDFWASWCGPCQMMVPVFERVAHDYADRARFIKINTEQNPTLSSQYGIRSIPTVVILRAGSETARQAGAMDANRFSAWLDTYI